MQPNEEVLSIIESRNLGYHEACALIAIDAGDLDTASFHIERKRALISSVRPERPALPPPLEQRGATPPPSTIRRGRPARNNSEDIPVFEIGRGVPPMRKGELRTCEKCGQEKKGQGFPRGSLTCKSCLKGSTGVPPVIKAKPSTVDVFKQTRVADREKLNRRVCNTCGKQKWPSMFTGELNTCKACIEESGKAADAKHKGKPKEETLAPGEPNNRYKTCTVCGRVYQRTAFPDPAVNVCRHCKRDNRQEPEL